MKLDEYTIECSAPILGAMKQIDHNKKGFLIVIDDNEIVLGTLTDGNIRRTIINGKQIDGCINDIITKKFKKLILEDSISTAIDQFKNEAIKFLPVLDND